MPLSMGTRKEGAVVPVQDDAQLSALVSEVTEQFLRTRTKMTRCDVTLLLPAYQHFGTGFTPNFGNPTWIRGHKGGNNLWYPASVVKLAYAAAAMQYLKSKGRPFDALDSCCRPMIKISCNFQTGVVVDAITESRNVGSGSTSDPAYKPWLEKRKFTERFLANHNLLGNQIIVHKTYPTNSGETPKAGEFVLLRQFGKNQMCTNLTAQLLLSCVKDVLVPGSAPYLQQILSHDRWQPGSALGFGLVAGSVLYNKVGIAYGLLHDVAYCRLPSGKEFVLCAFSDGYEAGQPVPYDSAQLGTLLDMIVERLRLDEGNGAAVVRVDTATGGSRVQRSGAWEVASAARDKRGASYLCKRGGGPGGDASVTFNLAVPRAGRYEVCVMYPAAFAGEAGARGKATAVPHVVHHAGGTTRVVVSQASRGGRWVKLGDFSFERGGGRVVVSDAGVDGGSLVVANAVRASLWPPGGPAPPPPPSAPASPIPAPAPRVESALARPESAPPRTMEANVTAGGRHRPFSVSVRHGRERERGGGRHRPHSAPHAYAGHRSTSRGRRGRYGRYEPRHEARPAPPPPPPPSPPPPRPRAPRPRPRRPQARCRRRPRPGPRRGQARCSTQACGGAGPACATPRGGSRAGAGGSEAPRPLAAPPRLRAGCRGAGGRPAAGPTAGCCSGGEGPAAAARAPAAAAKPAGAPAPPREPRPRLPPLLLRSRPLRPPPVQPQLPPPLPARPPPPLRQPARPLPPRRPPGLPQLPLLLLAPRPRPPPPPAAAPAAAPKAAPAAAPAAAAKPAGAVAKPAAPAARRSGAFVSTAIFALD
eukprot:tig00020537_g10226.t1